MAISLFILIGRGVRVLFSWFDAREVKQFGIHLASIYVDGLPPKKELSEKKSKAITRQILSKMGREVSQFKSTQKLNTYKIAQMCNAFKWTLKNAGYDEHLVNKLTEWLVAASQ